MTDAVRAKFDPTRSVFATILGRKGSGKSVLARWLWGSYPYDRLVIDPTRDADAGDDVADVHHDLMPPSFPVDPEGKRVSLRYVPDMGSDTWEDDVDRAVGLAFHHPKRCLLWADEVHVLTRANKTGPHMRRALYEGRHRNLSLLMCGPRAVDVNPLVLGQADYLYVFDLPHPHDRDRVAAVMGVKPAELHPLLDQLPQYHYLRWDAGEQDPELRLVQFPPLPLAKRRSPPSSPTRMEALE